MRGKLHQGAFFVSLGACAVLVAASSAAVARLVSLTYSFGLLALFSISAMYHRINWTPPIRRRMKALDHAAIYLFIAATMTPFAMLALAAPTGPQFLMVAWGLALAGVLQSIFWVDAPKWLPATFYVAMGWVALLYAPQIYRAIGSFNFALIVAGGVFYTVGALCYVTRLPRLKRAVFSYHELFHAFTILIAVLHFAVIYQLVSQAR